MALSKVDLSKQIVVLQNVWISACDMFNSVISFLTERHKRQREIILKMLIADSNKRGNTKKKEPKPSRYWVRPGRSNMLWTNNLNNKATLEEWRENFRMSEASFYMLCEELRPYLTKQTTKLRKPVSVETQTAVTLYHLVDEGRMRKVSNSFGLGKLTVSKVIRRVTSVASEKLGSKYIVLPKTKEEVEEHVQNFCNKYGFLNALVLLTVHIKIKRPVDSPTNYVNRNSNFTLNCQGTGGYNYCFIDVLIKWPGSVHDARVFGNSGLNGMFRDGTIPKCERIIAEGEPELPVCILGDPTYPLLPFLMKEYSKGGKNSREHLFGQRLSSARMVIECAFGPLKARFGCLRREWI